MIATHARITAQPPKSAPAHALSLTSAHAPEAPATTPAHTPASQPALGQSSALTTAVLVPTVPTPAFAALTTPFCDRP